MDTKETCIPNIKVFQDWPLLVEFKQLCSNYEPFVARSAYDLPAQRHQILAFLNSTSELTDISCAEGEGAFPGNPSSREKVDMKASDFASAWSCEKEGKPHWALTTGLNLYLSQLCLSEGNSAFNKGHEMLQCAIPSVLVQSEASLDRTNLWMNIFPAVSTLHYDANNNLLIVLEGIKHVTLFSPSCTKYLQPEAAHADYPNHSRLSPLEAETLTSSIFERRESGCTTWRVAVGEGDALFIPEGWWHQVRSEKCTMALNFWFHSGMHELLQQPPTAGTDMSSYLLRAAMHRAVDAQRSADAQRIASAVSAGEARGGSPLTVTQQCFDDFTLQLLSHSSAGTESETGRDRARGAHAEEDPWLAFVSCDLASMRARWIPFGQKYPREWTQVLLSLSPAAADRLLAYWDAIDGGGGGGGGEGGTMPQGVALSDAAQFFEEVFRPCGDAVPQVRRHLLAQKDRHSEQFALQVLQSVLGIDARALLQI